MFHFQPGFEYRLESRARMPTPRLPVHSLPPPRRSQHGRVDRPTPVSNAWGYQDGRSKIKHRSSSKWIGCHTWIYGLDVIRAAAGIAAGRAGDRWTTRILATPPPLPMARRGARTPRHAEQRGWFLFPPSRPLGRWQAELPAPRPRLREEHRETFCVLIGLSPERHPRLRGNVSILLGVSWTFCVPPPR